MARQFVLAFVLLLSGIVAMGCEGLATDTPSLPITDTGVPAEPGVNGCGGEGELSFGTAEALPGGACGICQDGVLFCTGPDALACGAPSPPNGCGGCGLLEGEPGTSCGLCDDGQWSCGGGKVSCIGESQSNSCGGCEPLSATPGELCLLGTGEDGLTICVGRASTACVSLGRNLCGGSSALALPVGIRGAEPRPGARYDDGCRAGVLYCEGDALAALDVRVPNACGGCVPLLGEPGTSCNACGADWSCAEDGSVACVGPRVNACGGCTELPSPLGASCGAKGGRVSCIGTEALGCAIPGISNACGGLAQLAGAPLGSACGECSDGVVVCDATDASRGRTVCSAASAANACGGCATLEAPPGGRCGNCGTGTLVCGAAGAGLVCEGDLGDAARNACGGCGALSPAVGVDCGRCGTTACDPSLPGQLRCVEPEAGCTVPAVCGNGTVEAGEQCDAGSANGLGSCSISCACSAGFHLEGGDCVADLLPLGAPCGLAIECSSGFCASGHDGTANDRCAPEGMNYIPAGTFIMGAPSSELGTNGTETQHSVTLSFTFFLGQTEVTQGQWKALSGGLNPADFQNTTCVVGACASTENANDNGPVEKLDWYSAVGFANARSAAEGLTSCYTLSGCTDQTNGWKDGVHSGCSGATFGGLTCSGYRLPTESEWEYAARGGTNTATYLGDLSEGWSDCSTAQASLDGIAWWCGNAGSRTHAVGGKTPNSFGLFDMLGNVYEYTSDWYGTYPATVTDPLGAATGSDRIFRGGSWYDSASLARAASRPFATPSTRYSSLGLRLARTAP